MPLGRSTWKRKKLCSHAIYDMLRPLHRRKLQYCTVCPVPLILFKRDISNVGAMCTGSNQEGNNRRPELSSVSLHLRPRTAVCVHRSRAASSGRRSATAACTCARLCKRCCSTRKWRCPRASAERGTRCAGDAATVGGGRVHSVRTSPGP